MKKLRLIIIITTTLSVLSCNVTRKLSSGEYLLTKNEIRINYADSIHRKDRSVTPELLERFIPTKQTPNKRVLGINFSLWMYNMYDSTKKQNIFQRTFRKIGDEPVLLDYSSISKSTKEMGLFMDASGFYSSSISDTIILKKKRAYVKYNITSGAPLKISNISYNFIDSSLRNIILADTSSSLLKIGETLDRTKLEQERSKIARNLENYGYYLFSVNNISYTVDTLNKNRTAELTVNILKEKSGTTLSENKIYRIKDIYINPNYSYNETLHLDTLEYHGYNFIYQHGLKQNIHAKTVSRALTLYPNSIYSRREIDYTSSNISNLKYFKNVNILFSEVKSDSSEYISYIGNNGTTSTSKEGALNCYIQCQPVLRQGYKLESEISSNSNYTSISLSAGYINKNLFKRAEIFNINVKTAYDFMRSKSKKDSYEFGISTSLALPRMLVPFNITRYNKSYNVHTTFELSYSTQRRPDYDRTLSSVAFGYSWNNGKKLSYIFKPISVNVINVPWINPDFLATIQNNYLRNSYKSQLILGMFGSFNFNNKTTSPINVSSVNVNIETSGNFLDLISHSIAKPSKQGSSDDRYYKAFGIRYAQYVRADASYIFKHNINNKGSAIVLRLYAGRGYAYGNTKSIPFERMFFAGGASSMRGWQVRTLGPGSTPEIEDTKYPNQVGDVKLETNIESRFGIFGPLKGAVFFDMGNIWSNGAGEKNADARFNIKTFYKQLALNTGIGARLDFSYFILRVDWGIQLRNPGWPKGQTWIRDFKLKNTAIHFGIGYPF